MPARGSNSCIKHQPQTHTHTHTAQLTTLKLAELKPTLEHSSAHIHQSTALKTRPPPPRFALFAPPPLPLPHHLEPAQLLGVLVGVGAVWQQAGVISVQHIVDLVLGEQIVEEVGGEVIGHLCVWEKRVRGGLRGQEEEERQGRGAVGLSERACG